MQENGIKGSIINVTSIEDEYATGGNVHYSASKAVINQITKALAVETGQFGIRLL